MDILLMAAGFGSRLKERTQDLPKALIPVAGKPLIYYALDTFLSRPWVDRMVVVTGFEQRKVSDFLGSQVWPKEVVEVFNPDYEKGNFYSLLKGLERVGSSFLVTNVDHLFPIALVDAVEKSSHKLTAVGAVVDFDRPLTPDCMKVQRDPNDGSILRIHKQLKSFHCGYIGMTSVVARARDSYFAAVERVRDMKDPKAYAEMVLQELAQSGGGVQTLDASGFGWLEVDDELDLYRAEDTLTRLSHFRARGFSAADRA
jgi:choline kinase